MKKINTFILCFALSNIFICQANDGWYPLASATTQTINSLYFTDVNTGYAAANGGVIIKTANAGENWSALSSGTSNDIQKINFASSLEGYFTTKNGEVFKTINGGSSWTGSKIHDLAINGISFHGTLGIVVGDEGFVATSSDGSTWTTQINLGVFTLNDVVVFNDSLAIAVGASGSIFRTADAGITWSSLNSGTTYSLSSIEKMSDGSAVIVGTNGTILYLNPISKSIQNKSNSSNTKWLKDIHCNENNCFITGFGPSYLLGDLSGNFNNRTLDSLENYNAIFFSSNQFGFMAGINGKIYRNTINGFAVGVVDVSESSLTVYPNPSQNSINFEFTDLETKNFQLRIMDTNGKDVYSENLNNSKTTIDINHLSSGVYFYNLTSAEGTLNGKFIKQ